jgi:hypothetical protein
MRFFILTSVLKLDHLICATSGFVDVQTVTSGERWSGDKHRVFHAAALTNSPWNASWRGARTRFKRLMKTFQQHF